MENHQLQLDQVCSNDDISRTHTRRDCVYEGKLWEFRSFSDCQTHRNDELSFHSGSLVKFDIDDDKGLTPNPISMLSKSCL